jgi:hypothetical protein
MPVTRLDITSEGDFAGSESFGDVGSYRLLEGTAHFAVDPLSPRNEAITDIELAPRDSGGNVRFSSHFSALRPADPDRGNGRVLFDVLNRGNRTVLSLFNGTPRPADPTSPLLPGNGFLMRHGYTVVWCGWQADVPPTPGLMGMQAPEAVGPGGPMVGETLCWLQVDEPTRVQMLSNRGHLPLPAADPDEPSARLLVGDHPNGPAEEVSRDRWSFVRVEDEQVEPDPSHVYMADGFEPGRIYQLVYTTRGSRMVGLGFAAVRDIVSFLKYAPADAGNPCAGDIERAYALGSSQSGRFLRQMVHLGLNEDEEERLALDGIIAHVAGGMRGEFNLRFGQPSKDICFVIPELFPFTDTEQTDPVTGRSGSLLARMEERGKLPKIMFTNTSAEYWRGDAALIHTDLETMSDAPESEHVRRYHFAGTQHGPGVFPPMVARPMDSLKGQLPFNSVDYSPLIRAALQSLDRWVSTGEPAPPSRHPRLADGTAVESRTLVPRLARLPGVRADWQPTRAMRLDYGPEAHLGRATVLPAVRGEEYPALVSDVDDDGNEIAGVRLPDLSVPLATYSGWNLRHPDIGNPDLVIGITGGLLGWTLPLPATRAEREAAADPRPSIEERYASREAYLSQVEQSARALVDEGYLLAEDLEEIVDGAAARYDLFAASDDGR